MEPFEVFDQAIPAMAAPEIAAWWDRFRSDFITGLISGYGPKIADTVRMADQEHDTIVDELGLEPPIGLADVIFNPKSPASKPWELDGAQGWQDGEHWVHRRAWCMLAFFAVRRGAKGMIVARERLLTEFPTATCCPDHVVRKFWQSYWSVAALWDPEDSRTQFVDAMIRLIDDPRVPEPVDGELAEMLARVYKHLLFLKPITLQDTVGQFLERNEDSFGKLPFAEEVLDARRSIRPPHRR